MRLPQPILPTPLFLLSLLPHALSLSLLTAITDLPPPDPSTLSISSAGNPGTPGCVYLGTGPHWSGNTTYKCPDVGQNELPCIANAPFQTSLGPDAGTVCVTFRGDRCQSETLMGAVRWPGNACMGGFGSFFCWKSERGVVGMGVGEEEVGTLEEGDCGGSSVGGGSTSSRGGSSVEGSMRTSVGDVKTTADSEVSSGSQHSKTDGTSGAVTGAPEPSQSSTGLATNTGVGISIGTSNAGTSQSATSPADSEKPSQSGNKPPQTSRQATQGTFTLISAALPPSQSQSGGIIILPSDSVSDSEPSRASSSRDVSDTLGLTGSSGVSTGESTGEPTGGSTDASTGGSTGTFTGAPTGGSTGVSTDASTDASTNRPSSGASTDVSTGTVTGKPTQASTGASTDASRGSSTGTSTGESTGASTDASTGESTQSPTGASTEASNTDTATASQPSSQQSAPISKPTILPISPTSESVPGSKFPSDTAGDSSFTVFLPSGTVTESTRDSSVSGIAPSTSGTDGEVSTTGSLNSGSAESTVSGSSAATSGSTASSASGSSGATASESSTVITSGSSTATVSGSSTASISGSSTATASGSSAATSGSLTSSATGSSASSTSETSGATTSGSSSATASQSPTSTSREISIITVSQSILVTVTQSATKPTNTNDSPPPPPPPLPTPTNANDDDDHHGPPIIPIPIPIPLPSVLKKAASGAKKAGGLFKNLFKGLKSSLGGLKLPSLPSLPGLGRITSALDSLRGLGCNRRDSDTTFLCRGRLPGTPALPDIPTFDLPNFPNGPGPNDPPRGPGSNDPPRGPDPNDPPHNPNDPPQNPNDPPRNPNDPPQNPNDPPRGPNPNDPPQGPNPNNPPQNPDNPPQNPDNPQQPDPNNPQEPNPDNPQEPNPDNPQEPNPDNPQDPDDPPEPDPDHDREPEWEEVPHDGMMNDIRLADFYHRYFELDINDMRYGDLATDMARISYGPRVVSAEGLIDYIEHNPPLPPPDTAGEDAEVSSTVSSYYRGCGDQVRARILSASLLDGNPVEGPLGPRPDSADYNPLDPGGGAPSYRDSLYTLMHRNEALLQLVGITPLPPYPETVPDWFAEAVFGPPPRLARREGLRKIPKPNEKGFYDFLAEAHKFLNGYMGWLNWTGLFEKMNSTHSGKPKGPAPTTLSTAVSSRSRANVSSVFSSTSNGTSLFTASSTAHSTFSSTTRSRKSASTSMSSVSSSAANGTSITAVTSSASTDTGIKKSVSASTNTSKHKSGSSSTATYIKKHKEKSFGPSSTSSSFNMDSTAHPQLCIDKDGNIEQGCRW